MILILKDKRFAKDYERFSRQEYKRITSFIKSVDNFHDFLIIFEKELWESYKQNLKFQQ